MLYYFPEFIKVDFLAKHKIRDVAFGHFTVTALCWDSKVFMWGANSQIGIEVTDKIIRQPLDLTAKFLNHSMIESENEIT